VAPGDLYRNGLHRERFLPTIAMLEAHMDVVELPGDTDYRLRLLQSAGTWIVPADERAGEKLERYFHDVAAGSVAASSEVQIAGRTIPSHRRAPGIAWFGFAALCEGPRSQEDYIEIARGYSTVVLSGVPVLTAADDDAARRFISLVDEFYDRRVKLLVSAAAAIDGLYTGRRLAFEFRRTASRLVEMQTTEYLHAPHLS
jgi:cell division protein ZapE